MIKIGITGGIGSGKSTVCRAFAQLGVPVYDSDSRARRLMNEDVALKAAVSGLFGDGAYDADGLNRKYVAGRIFSDGTLRERLNAVVHPAVAEDFARWAERQQGPYVIEEAAILFESGAYRQMDKVVTVTAPEPERIRRTCLRDGVAPEAVRARMAAQIDEAERIARNHLEYHLDGRCALIYLTRDEIEQSRVDPADLEELTSLPISIEGVKVGLTLRQQPGGSYRISVRTAKGVDACAIARRLGGGGHNRAAGCELLGNLENAKNAILAEVEAELDAPQEDA